MTSAGRQLPKPYLLSGQGLGVSHRVGVQAIYSRFDQHLVQSFWYSVRRIVTRLLRNVYLIGGRSEVFPGGFMCFHFETRQRVTKS